MSSAVQMGFTQSAEGLNTTKNRRTPSFYSCWLTQAGTWLSSAPGLNLPPVAPGSPILHELYHQLHRISSSRTAREETSLPHYYVTQLNLYILLLLVLLLQRILTEEHVSQNGKAENETM